MKTLFQVAKTHIPEVEYEVPVLWGSLNVLCEGRIDIVPAG